MGEGWHNNHHRHAHLARQGLRWWEIDVTWYVLVVLEKLHVIWGVRRPRADEHSDRELIGGVNGPDDADPREPAAA